MRKCLATAIFMAAMLSCAYGQSSQFNVHYPPGSAAITATATGTTAATATLAARQAATTYICTLQVTSAGTTGGSVAITNTATGQLNYVLSGVTPLVVAFTPCVPANAANTTVVVTGTFTGGTASAVNATGYQLPQP